jgi:hypothetical protein
LPAPILLAIAVERSAPPPELELRPRQAKKWIESLPPAVTFESGRQLVAHLSG